MNYRRLLELFWEFTKKIEDWHTLYLDSIAGYSILHERLLNKQEDAKKMLGDHEYAETTFQDELSINYKRLCGIDFIPVSMKPLMKQGEVKKRLCKNGQNYLLLGNQCVVTAYSYWEEYLRIEVAIAIGVLKRGAKNSKETRKILNEHLNVDFWGDMKLIRHSILHNNGIASSDISKCKIIKCFYPGKLIEIDYEKMRAIFLSMGWYRNKLHEMSLPPSEGITVPMI